jgi:hypothetical protein
MRDRNRQLLINLFISSISITITGITDCHTSDVMVIIVNNSKYAYWLLLCIDDNVDPNYYYKILLLTQINFSFIFIKFESFDIPFDTEKLATVTFIETIALSMPFELSTTKSISPESSGLTDSISNVDVKQFIELLACERIK